MAEQLPDVKFDVGHVLFIDIVGYAKLLITESQRLQTLRQIVRSTEQFQLAKAEGKLLGLPTGDGGALVFRNSPEARSLRDRDYPFRKPCGLGALALSFLPLADVKTRPPPLASFFGARSFTFTPAFFSVVRVLCFF